MAMATLSTAANGHCMLCVDQADSSAWHRLQYILEEELGFAREGRIVEGLDDGLLPDFVNDAMRLRAGWDIWSGAYLLASCPVGDALLADLGQRLNGES